MAAVAVTVAAALAGPSPQRMLDPVKPTEMMPSPLMAGLVDGRGAWAELSTGSCDGLLAACVAKGAER